MHPLMSATTSPITSTSVRTKFIRLPYTELYFSCICLRIPEVSINI